MPSLNGEALFGVYSCLLALQEGRRKCYTLFVKENFHASDHPVRKQILQLAEEKEVHVEVCAKRTLDLLSQARIHQASSKIIYV